MYEHAGKHSQLNSTPSNPPTLFPTLAQRHKPIYTRSARCSVCAGSQCVRTSQLMSMYMQYILSVRRITGRENGVRACVCVQNIVVHHRVPGAARYAVCVCGCVPTKRRRDKTHNYTTPAGSSRSAQRCSPRHICVRLRAHYRCTNFAAGKVTAFFFLKQTRSLDLTRAPGVACANRKENSTTLRSVYY